MPLRLQLAKKSSGTKKKAAAVSPSAGGGIGLKAAGLSHWLFLRAKIRVRGMESSRSARDSTLDCCKGDGDKGVAKESRQIVDQPQTFDSIGHDNPRHPHSCVFLSESSR